MTFPFKRPSGTIGVAKKERAFPMRLKYFDNNIEPACEYCSFGKACSGNDMILCQKKGIVAPYYQCRHFRYDPLRRKPKPLAKLDTSAFTAEDFML